MFLTINWNGMSIESGLLVSLYATFYQNLRDDCIILKNVLPPFAPNAELNAENCNALA